jgi:hypothetical protein
MRPLVEALEKADEAQRRAAIVWLAHVFHVESDKWPKWPTPLR